MGIVTLQNVHVGFAGQIVLDELDWVIHRGEKVGLVGPNGSGKTTLFKLITGDVQPQVGTVTRARGLQVAYLPQEPTLDTSNTLLAEATRTFDNVRQLEERVAEVAQLIADHHDTDRVEDLMAEYGELQHRLEASGGYNYEVTVREVLGGLGFTPADYDLPVAALSGGQKCRAALAELLLQEADLLLLDEPTNHLDIEATQFLERFLAGYHGAAIIVSHDRYLLDRVVDKIVDLDNRRVTVYPCAYSDYAEAKRIRRLTAEREYERQKEWMDHQWEYAQRVKADKSRSKQARGRLTRLARMEREGSVLSRPGAANRRMAIQFTPSQHSGDMVLRCEAVRKAYGDVVLFDNFNLEICRGEKIGIVGPNGVGKTTLLRMAMRKIDPDAGTVRLFENLQVGYYDQEHEDLKPELTVIEEIDPRASQSQQAHIRSFLARFLFQGDDVFKPVGTLSGGEQSRVMLARLMYTNPQVLILDEPTNHLDIPAKEVLEDALIAYQGAVLLVSHDRYFLDRVVNKLLVLPERAKYETLTGNWSTYANRIAEQEARRRTELDGARKQARRTNRVPTRRPPSGEVAGDDSPYASWSIDRIEEAIIEKETALTELEGQFADPAIYRDAERARSLRAASDRLRADLTALNIAWESRIN